MKKLTGVFSSDSVNKKQVRFTTGALEYELSKKWQKGHLSNVGHDIHKSLGWGKPVSLYLEPQLTRLLGVTYVPESDKENKIINKARYNCFNEYQSEMCSPYIDELSTIIKDHVQSEAQYVFTSCITALEDNLAVKAFPKLFEKADDDHLIELDSILKNFELLGPGYFRQTKSGLVVMAHRFFRKSLSIFNNFNVEFLQSLMNFSKNKVKIRIALDPNAVGLAKSYLRSMEFEFWWGPKFKNDIDSMDPGVTVHVLEDELQRLYSDIDKTEFWFKRDETLRIFEIEELVQSKSFNNNNWVYANRYAHSIYNTDSSEFKHFDGAVKTYNEIDYEKRKAVNINSAGKKAHYTKLFRIDELPSEPGISVSEWKSLLHEYFRGNILIAEYFRGEKFNEYERPIDKSDGIVYEKCPYLIERNQGVRIMLSYLPKEKNNNFERKIEVYDWLSRGDELINVIEHDIIELKKVLRSLGEHIEIPNDVNLIACEDMYLNLPLIKHGNINFPNNIQMTVKAISIIIENLVQRNTDHVIAANISWPTETREIRLSIYGQVIDLDKWFKEFSANLPMKDSELHDWVLRNNKWLNSNYPRMERPRLENISKDTGLLWVGRKLLEQDEEINFYSGDRGLMYNMKLPTTKNELFEVIEKGIISPVCAYLIKKSKCRKCGRDYLKCKHSKYIDEGVVHEVVDGDLALVFWTDKKA